MCVVVAAMKTLHSLERKREERRDGETEREVEKGLASCLSAAFEH